MPNLVEIHPVIWAPNLNKQTNKQTASYIYIDIYGINILEAKSFKCALYFAGISASGL